MKTHQKSRGDKWTIELLVSVLAFDSTLPAKTHLALIELRIMQERRHHTIIQSDHHSDLAHFDYFRPVYGAKVELLLARLVQYSLYLLFGFVHGIFVRGKQRERTVLVRRNLWTKRIAFVILLTQR